ncbi:MAG: ribonuclease P protein component [Rhodobacteraceae bacterium]|nr:ribonuclease P protein component [Paracoccaceae bacterium]
MTIVRTARSCSQSSSPSPVAERKRCLSGATVAPIKPLPKRSDFIRVARGRRSVAAGCILQARKRRGPHLTEAIRVGFTCSRKIGSAVERNRCRRRLRSAARTVFVERARPGWDYVLIGRRHLTNSRGFQDLVNDLVLALDKIHGDHRHRT